jgi:hypothetical protein
LLIEGLDSGIKFGNVDTTMSHISGEVAVNSLMGNVEEIIGTLAFTHSQLCVEKIKNSVASIFSLEYNQLFVAGSQLTRLSTYSDNELSDVDRMLQTYATPHIDKANRQTYDISCVLYLNNSSMYKVSHQLNNVESTDNNGSIEYQYFEGGNFRFIDENMISTVVPKVGRLLLFESGSNNFHQVEKVLSGYRYTFAVWFTVK